MVGDKSPSHSLTLSLGAGTYFSSKTEAAVPGRIEGAAPFVTTNTFPQFSATKNPLPVTDTLDRAHRKRTIGSCAVASATTWQGRMAGSISRKRPLTPYSGIFCL